MCLALRKMHSAGRAHGDLRAQNIYMRNVNECLTCLLGSCGISADSNEAFDTEKIPRDVFHFASPEFYLGMGREAPADMWSLGSIIYHMCAFEPAFKGTSRDELINSTLNSQPARIPKEYSR